MQEQTCPNCDMPKRDWRGNDGEGYREGGVTYCCRGCAEGSGCTCL